MGTPAVSADSSVSGAWSSTARVPPSHRLIAGKYRVQRILGEGGMGMVYAAVHCELDQLVAVKVIRDEVARQPDIAERLLREARTTAMFRSEHVTRVLDAGRLDHGAPYIVMEFLEGADLASVLSERGRLSSELAVDYVLQACEAVAEAHAEGVVHRDLKPDNLFLTTRADGSAIIKVLDFGVSKVVSSDSGSSLTNPKMVVGSPEYMSPEQMSGASVVDGRTDIWSLGVVLFELLSNATPFTADTLPGVCARVLRDRPGPMSRYCDDVPPGLEAVVLRCLEKNAEDRFASVAELASALTPYGGEDAAELVGRVSRIATNVGSKNRATPASSRRRVGPEDETLPALQVPRNSSSTPAPIAFSAGVPKRQRARRAALAFLGLTLACAGAVGLWRVKRSSDGHVLVGAASAAEPAPVAAESELSDVRVEPSAILDAEGPSNVSPSRAGGTPVEPVRAEASSAAVEPAPARSNRPAAPKPRPKLEPSTRATGADAWDPASFGGRR